MSALGQKQTSELARIRTYRCGSRTTKQASCSSTDHGGGNRRAVVVVASLLAHLL